MPSEASSIPDEILYHFVTKAQSVDALFNTLYDQPSELNKQHFTAINSHLAQQVRPGQMVILTPPDAQQCTRFEADLMTVARIIDQQLTDESEQAIQAMAERYDLLSNLASYSGAGYGIAMNYFTHHKDQIEYVLDEIEKLHVKTWNSHRKLNTPDFFRHRQLLFDQLNRALKSMAGRARMGLNIDRKNIKSSLGLNTKSLLHQLKAHPVPIEKLPEFGKNHAQVKQYSKILKGAGYVGLTLDGLQSIAKIQQACTTGREEECTKSKFSQTGRLIGSVGGGAGVGKLVAYGLCNVFFSLPSGGSSFLWCGIVVGAAGGYFGAKLVGSIGEATGGLIYETTIRN